MLTEGERGRKEGKNIEGKRKGRGVGERKREGRRQRGGGGWEEESTLQ